MQDVKTRVAVDLSKNPKQMEYLTAVIRAVNRVTPHRKFAYGGAIRGGKTFVTLFILIWLCKRFPGSRWCIIRNDFPNLQRTTIESLKKILRGSRDWRWNQDKGNFFVEHVNGSRILFKAENIKQDPSLDKFLGLEVNGFFAEQLEELSQKTWEMMISRAGSWYLEEGEEMPPAFIFTTFNPTQKWPKQFIYQRHLDGELPEDFYFQTALPSDNAFVTSDQWNAWGTMAQRFQDQFIKGDWTDFDDDDPRWCYSFNVNRHVKPTLPFYPAFPIYTMWDFNREPMTCTVAQRSTSIGTPDSFVHFIKEYKIDAQIHEICARINSDFPGSVKYVCGDVSGKKGDVGYNERHMTHYKLIAQAFNIKNFSAFVNLNKFNLEHGDSRLLVNTMLHVLPKVYFSYEGCPNLIAEYQAAKVDVDHVKSGHLLKDRQENKLDLFDGSRYFWQTYFLEYLDAMLRSMGQQSLNNFNNE